MLFGELRPQLMLERPLEVVLVLEEVAANAVEYHQRRSSTTNTSK